MRKALFAFSLIVAFLISSQIWAFDISMRTEIEGGSKPTIIGNTNLPSGLELTITLSRKDNSYIAQDNVKVDGGEFKSATFSQGGAPLQSGEYTIEISSSFADYQSLPIYTVIGKNGIIGNERVIYHKISINIGDDTTFSKPIYWLRAKIEGWNKPTITGLTNLPTDTELTVTLWRDGHEAKDNIKIVNLNKYGYDFKSSAFSHEPLKPGKYNLEISQSIDKFRSLNANVAEGVDIMDDRVVYYKTQFSIIAWTRVSKSPWGEFKGVPLGAPVEFAMDKMPVLDCSGADGTWICVSRYLDIGKAVIDYCSMEFKQNKMVSIYMTFKSDNYEYLKDVFLKKYGKQSSSRNYMVQTGFGVKHNNQSFKWSDGKVNLVLEKYTSNINDGSIFYITNDEINANEKETNKSKKKAVKDL